MRLILSLVFICSLIGSLSAQSTQYENSVFVNKDKITFLNTCLEDLDSAIDLITEAHEKQDVDIMYKQKTKVLGALNNIESNCDKIVSRIKTTKRLEDYRKERYGVDNPDYHNYFHRRDDKDERLEHVKIDEKELNLLSQYSDSMTSMLSEVKDNQKDFFLGEANAKVNLVLATELKGQAQKFYDIINSKIVSQ